MLAGNRDHLIMLLPFLGWLVESIGLVEVVHSFQVAKMAFLQRSFNLRKS